MNSSIIALALKGFKNQKVVFIFMYLVLTAVYAGVLIISSLMNNLPQVMRNELDIYDGRNNIFYVDSYVAMDEIQELYDNGVEHTEVYFYDGTDYLYNDTLMNCTLFCGDMNNSDCTVKAYGKPIHYMEDIDVIEGTSINASNYNNGIWINSLFAQDMDLSVGDKVTQYIFSEDGMTSLTTKEYNVMGIIMTVGIVNYDTPYFYYISVQDASEIYSYIHGKDIESYFVECSVYGLDNLYNTIDSLKSSGFSLGGEVIRAVDEVNSSINAINIFLLSMCLAICVFAAITINNINYFYLNKNRKTVAMYKCLGASNHVIVFMTMIRNCIVIIISLISAIILSLLANRQITEKILSIFSLNYSISLSFIPVVLLFIGTILMILIQSFAFAYGIKKNKLGLSSRGE